MALSAGYFFKCPLCNNKEAFEAEMKLFGVYVPEQDASWEREGDIFEGIYERHGHCDADQCLCPDGRTFDEDYTIWEIVRSIYIAYIFDNVRNVQLFTNVPTSLLRPASTLLSL